MAIRLIHVGFLNFLIINHHLKFELKLLYKFLLITINKKLYKFFLMKLEF